MYYGITAGIKTYHKTFPDGSIELTVFVVLIDERCGLVGELIDEDLELENCTVFGAIVLILYLGLQEQCEAVYTPVQRMCLVGECLESILP